MEVKDLHDIKTITDQWLGFVLSCNEDAWSDRRLDMLSKYGKADAIKPVKCGKREASRRIKGNVIRLNEICKDWQAGKVELAAEEQTIAELAEEIRQCQCIRFDEPLFPSDKDFTQQFNVGDEVYIKGAKIMTYHIVKIEESTGSRKGFIYQLDDFGGISGGSWVFYDKLRKVKK